jgi:hypothetical protein
MKTRLRYSEGKGTPALAMRRCWPAIFPLLRNSDMRNPKHFGIHLDELSLYRGLEASDLERQLTGTLARDTAKWRRADQLSVGAIEAG